MRQFQKISQTFSLLRKLSRHPVTHGLGLTTSKMGYGKSIPTILPTIRTAKSDGGEENS